MLNSLELFFINILLKKKFLPSHFIIRKKTFFSVQNYKQKQLTFIIFKIYFYLISKKIAKKNSKTMIQESLHVYV
jgi:hypothetical protein